MRDGSRSHTFTGTEEVGMCLVQRLAELKLRGGDGGCIRPAERRFTRRKALTRRTGKGTERRAQLESALPRERSACCHALKRVNDGELRTRPTDWMLSGDIAKRLACMVTETESAVRANHLLWVSHPCWIYFSTIQHPSFLITNINLQLTRLQLIIRSGCMFSGEIIPLS